MSTVKFIHSLCISNDLSIFSEQEDKKADSVKDSTDLNGASVNDTHSIEKVSTDGLTKYIFLYFLAIHASTSLKEKM